MYLDFCFLLKHSCTNAWLCREYTEKRKNGHKTFCLGNGTDATAPNIWTCCSNLISTLSQFLFWTLHLGMCGTFCQQLHCAGHVQNSLAWHRVNEHLCGLGKCPTGHGSVPWGVRGLGWLQNLGESSTGITESQGLLQLGGGLLLLPHSPGERQRLEHINLIVTHK